MILDQAKSLRDTVKHERNKHSERDYINRKHHHIHLKRAGGISRNFRHVWINIPDSDILEYLESKHAK